MFLHSSILSRIVSTHQERPAYVPEGAAHKRLNRVPTKGRAQRIEKEARGQQNDGMQTDMKLLRDTQEEQGADFSVDLRAEWDLKDPSWRYDDIPEILEGKNVADFIDPDIMSKLEALEVRLC